MDTFTRSVPKRSALRLNASGFSLVEVTVAIGIVSFSVIGISGLLLTGGKTFHQALDISVSTQITDRIMNEAQQTDFQDLINSTNPPTRFFDDQGNELSSAVGAIYQARTLITPSTSTPSTSTSSAPNPDLATVVVQVANNPGNLTPQLDPVNPKLWNDPRLAITTYSGLVANNPQ